ncbi:hypothetical protein B296_00053004 [Ensete ventricosum]|uniref:Uncharacterized protein n=1 Tax=Ensete ventricosum TaxID=4639 RepID=A0A426X5G4_ENSVE|nr:hypothetical protein B296_00053004 [Ensete ventricosum]
MDWRRPDDETWEVSGDSEVDDAMAIGIAAAYDSDDAESSSGCGGGDDEGGAAGREADERCMSWSGWLAEYASQYEVVADVVVGCDQKGANGSASGVTGPEAAMADAESDRLFWEACLAHGYP